jgi:threonine dehydratase
MLHNRRMTTAPLTIEAIRATRAALGTRVVTTPTLDWQCDEIVDRLGPDARVNLKLELFQRTGTFKARGALNVMLGLSPEQRARGVTAVSAGNHAIATAYAARSLGSSAKVVMLASANPARVERCRKLGAEVEIAPDGASAFERARRIEAEEGRSFIHPFEGPLTALGTATIGLEWIEQAGPLDAVICPIGGGGLIAGPPPRSSCFPRIARSTASSPRAPTICAAASRRASPSPMPGSRRSPTASPRPIRCPTASTCAAGRSTRSSWSPTTSSARA